MPSGRDDFFHVRFDGPRTKRQIVFCRIERNVPPVITVATAYRGQTCLSRARARPHSSFGPIRGNMTACLPDKTNGCMSISLGRGISRRIPNDIVHNTPRDHQPIFDLMKVFQYFSACDDYPHKFVLSFFEISPISETSPHIATIAALRRFRASSRLGVEPVEQERA